MNRKDYAKMTKAANTLYEYAYLTGDDFQRIDSIDEEIYNIDKKLSYIVINKNDESIGSIIKNGSFAYKNGNSALNLVSGAAEVLKRISAFTNVNNGSGKVPHDELNKRKRLIFERAEIIEGSREKMKMNNPEQYENITNIINQQRLEMKNGTFDISSLIGI